MKRRLVRYLVASVVLVAFTGYFAFSTFLFSPLEADYEYDLSTLIPRDVDVYLAKAGLAGDFDPFPDVAGLDELSGSRAGAAFRATRLYTETVQPALADLRASLDEGLAEAPVAIDPLDVFGGRDLAVAAYLQGRDLADARWAAYGRVNWMGKLAFSLLGYPGLAGLEAQGLAVAEDEGVLTISGGQLRAPLHAARVLDVVVVGSDAGLVRAALQLDAEKGADSFGQSARYHDTIDAGERPADELEFFVDYMTLADEMGLTGRWPDTRSPDFGIAFLGRLFQAASLKELIGTLHFEGLDGGGTAVSVDVSGELSSELVTPVQKKLYRSRHFDKDRFRREVARFAPADSALFLYLHADVGDLLRQALDALDSATLGLIEDQIRAVWGYGTAEGLVEEVEKAFHDRLALVVRANDYPEDPEGPPHNDDPVPAWGLVLWSQDVGKVEEMIQTVVSHQAQFGLQGRTPGSSGVFRNQLAGGQLIYEYWSQQISGTGHLASVRDSDFFIVSNSFRMLEQMLKTYYEGDRDSAYPGLTSDATFQELVYEGLDNGTLMAWLRPRTVGEELREAMRIAARAGVVVNVKLERARIEREVLAEQFGGRQAGQLAPQERDTLDALVDERVRALVNQVQADQVPRLYAEYERNVVMAEALEAALVQIALDPKALRLGLGARVRPVEPAE